MSKSSIVHDPVLLRESLTIKKIICFASGESGWPPTDEFWDGIQADLKDACERGELPHSKNPSDPRRRFYYIRLHDLREFLINRDQRWQPLRDFCRRWENARGITLSPAEADGLASLLSPPENKSQLAPEPPRRGVPKGKTSSFPKPADPAARKRRGGRKHGPYYGPLKKHLKWRNDNMEDLDTASLKDLRKDARSRLTTDNVRGIPKSRSAFEDAIKAVLRDLGVNR